MRTLLPALLIACATPPPGPAVAPEAPPAEQPEALAEQAEAPAEPPAPAAEEPGHAEAQAPPSAPAPPTDPTDLRARLEAPDAPERRCTADADCALVKLTCCAPLESVHNDHVATFDVARDNPRCRVVRCMQPPERVAKCLDQRCTAVAP